MVIFIIQMHFSREISNFLKYKFILYPYVNNLIYPISDKKRDNFIIFAPLKILILKIGQIHLALPIVQKSYSLPNFVKFYQWFYHFHFQTHVTFFIIFLPQNMKLYLCEYLINKFLNYIIGKINDRLKDLKTLQERSPLHSFKKDKKVTRKSMSNFRLKPTSYL